MLHLPQITIRDPFIVPYAAQGIYYLFGTTHLNPTPETPGGFDFYTSADLTAWDGPFPAFRAGAEMKQFTRFWAPEVHQHAGFWWMFASMGTRKSRGTYVLRASSPAGPFELWSDGPVTPADEMAIDGTPFWDENGQGWLVYCHEWVQLTDGAMCARRLSPDLRRGEGASHRLFTASQAPWPNAVAQDDKPRSWVTDGPFFHRFPSGELGMMWSSRGDFGYDVGWARARNGSVLGPYHHEAPPIFGDNGGHSMLFRTFEGQLMMALHTEKFGGTKEYALLLAMDEGENELRIRR